MKKTGYTSLLLLGLSLLLTGCLGGSDGDSTPKPTTRISLKQPDAATFSLKDGPVTIELEGYDSSSPRDASLTWEWQIISKPANSTASLDADDKATTTFTTDLPGDYVVSLVVNDGTAKSSPARITLTATSPVPVANTRLHHSVRLGTENLGLDGSASTPPTGETGTLDYQWNLVSQPDSSGAYVSNASSAHATLHLDVEGEYIVRLIVSYQGINSAPALVQVVVAAGNAQPVAVAPDVTFKLGETVILDGRQSYDPENEPMQYRWSWSDLPKNVTAPELNGRTTASASFKPEAAGTYKLTFFVFDGQWKSENLTVTATVEPAASYPAVNNPPVGDLIASGYSPSASFGEQELGRRADFKFIGYDPDGDTLQIVSAELLEKPEGSAAVLAAIGSWEPLGRKIQTLDKVGTYRVRMTLTDGTNEITREASMEAKIGGINNRPSVGGLTVQSQSVLVGNALIFDASSTDPDLDPLLFNWILVDRPDGSKAVVEPMLEPESGEYRRARVVTDVPGSYTLRMIVRDDRGLQGVVPRETSGMAKLTNTPPEIRRVFFKRNWGSLAPGESYYQLLPCMSLLFSPLIIDLDGDKIYEHEELANAPAGGRYTSNPGADCPAGTSGGVFTKPGDYTFRYLASDGIDDSEWYNHTITIEPMENARGILLRSHGEDSVVLRPIPYENIPIEGYGISSGRPFLERRKVDWSIEAMDGDYTVVDVQLRHINGGLNDLTPQFEGLAENQVIRQGERLAFTTWFPTVTCMRTDDAAEGFHFSFRIKELPEATFVYENWLVATQGALNQWPTCAPGEVQ